MRARSVKDETWAAILLFIACYMLSMLVTASFDVALEGPILGFWYWTVFGVGVAACRIHRYRLLRATRGVAGGHALAGGA
jgi:hypothetical protein